MRNTRYLALLALIAVPLLGAASGPQFLSNRQALQLVSRDDDDVKTCAQQHPAEMLAATSVSTLATQPRAVMISIEHSCICGAQNCPFYIYQLGSTPKELLTDFTIGTKTAPNPASTLPDIVSSSHDSAMISNVTRYTYRGGKYVVADTWRVRGDTNERKPLSMPVKFAAGASSTRLSGKVSMGWEDRYGFDASAGQQLLLSGVTPSKDLTFSLTPAGKASIDVKPGSTTALPQSGHYLLTVDVSPSASADQTISYGLTFGIK